VAFFRHDVFALLQIVEVKEQREINSHGICLMRNYWSGQMTLIVLTPVQQAVNWWFASPKVMWHGIVKSESSPPFTVVSQQVGNLLLKQVWNKK